MNLRDCLVHPDTKDVYYYEFDVSQLEITVLAALSQDPVLINECSNFVDIHSRNYSDFHGVPVESVTPEQRKFAKARTFELQYGATAWGMAKSGEVTKEQAQKFIDKFYNKYTKVHDLHQELVYTTYLNAKTNTELYNGAHGSMPMGYYRSPMGILFKFKPYHVEPNKYYRPISLPSHLRDCADENAILPVNFAQLNGALLEDVGSSTYKFSRPQILNYICQGTGYQVVNLLRNNFMNLAPDCFQDGLTNRLEIHDSEAGTISSTKDLPSVYSLFNPLLEEALHNTKKQLVNDYKWPVWKDLPLKVEYQIGATETLGGLRDPTNTSAIIRSEVST